MMVRYIVHLRGVNNQLDRFLEPEGFLLGYLVELMEETHPGHRKVDVPEQGRNIEYGLESKC